MYTIDPCIQVPSNHDAQKELVIIIISIPRPCTLHAGYGRIVCTNDHLVQSDKLCCTKSESTSI